MFKIGLIGLGNISSKHVVAIRNNPDLCLTGGYDIDSDKAYAWSTKNNIVLYDSIESIIDANDILVVLTPHNTHSNIVKKIVSKNKWCICEKPLCINVAEFGDIANTDKIFVISQNRYNKAIMDAKDKVEQGYFGKVNFMQFNTLWYRDREYYTKSSWRGRVDTEGGILYNQGIHSLDMALYLLNASSDDCKILSVYRSNYNSDIIDTESIMKIVMDIKGVLVDMLITTDFSKINYENSALISGTQNSFKISGNHLNAIVYPETVTFDSTSDVYGSAHTENYNHILQYIRAGKGNPVLFSEGLDRIKLIERIYKTAKA